MSHQNKQHGYLMVDHRASPGLTEAEARTFGYLPELAGEGKLFEADTLCCAHCKIHTIKNPDRLRPRAICMACGGKYICDFCAVAAREPDYVHTPFDKRMEDIIRKEEAALGSPPALLIPPSHNEGSD